MGKELLKKSSLPTALCIASDTLAVGVLQALNEKRDTGAGADGAFQHQ